MLDEAAKMTMMRHENLLRIVGVCLSGDDLQVTDKSLYSWLKWVSHVVHILLGWDAAIRVMCWFNWTKKALKAFVQLVTLLRPLGNLREFLQKHKGKLSGKELLQYSYQIASVR